MEIQPGTIVKFKNLVGKPEYNGRCGVIRKQLPNGKFGVILDASEIDLSFKEDNLGRHYFSSRVTLVTQISSFWGRGVKSNSKPKNHLIL